MLKKAMGVFRARHFDSSDTKQNTCGEENDGGGAEAMVDTSGLDEEQEALEEDGVDRIRGIGL